MVRGGRSAKLAIRSVKSAKDGSFHITESLGKFGGWLQNTSRDHGQDEIAIAVVMLIEEVVEMQLAQGAEDGGDVAVRRERTTSKA